MNCPNESLIMEILDCEITSNIPADHLPFTYDVTFNDSRIPTIKHELEKSYNKLKIRLTMPGVIQVNLSISSLNIEYLIIINVEDRAGD